jgi:hypothetical protein
MKAATRAPFYACMYHGLCDIARQHGYALAINGTVTTDLDLVADEWSDQDYRGSTIDITKAHHVLQEFEDRKIRVVYRFFASTIIGDCEKLYWESAKLTAYWWIKWMVRKISGIKQGERGPSWL